MIRFSIPGKTFLAGEYLALKKGPALVLATQPRFEIVITNGNGLLTGIHSDSPAGCLIRQNQNFFSQFNIEFIDPYHGRGGWGASTAQFLAVYCLWRWQDACLLEAERYLDTQDLLKNYTECAWKGQGLPPSGADLIGQYKGKLTWFDRELGLINDLSWPFAEFEIILIQTGVKVATHQHLQQLGEFSSVGLAADMLNVKNSLSSQKSEEFISAIRNYAINLAKLGFVAERTMDLIHDLSWIDGVKAVKGCGALGADVVMVLCQKGQTKSLEQWLSEHEFYFIKATDQISPGLQIKNDGKINIKTSDREIVL